MKKLILTAVETLAAKHAPPQVIKENLFLKRFTCALLLVFLLMTPAAANSARPKYVFLFIGDGMGEQQVESAELALAKTPEAKLSFRKFPVSGSQRTQSLSNGATDSAAAATAIACGVRTRNGMLGMSISNQPLPSIARQAHEQGWKIGILTSVSIDHATPAGFYAHSASRGSVSKIAAAMAESTVSVLRWRRHGGAEKRPTAGRRGQSATGNPQGVYRRPHA
jgi:alkaline phosphatase